MRSSRYPRLGQRLAPSLLCSVLDVRIPRRLLSGETNETHKFSELDEKSWDRFSSETCRKLGDAIVEHIRDVLAGLPEEVREQHVPKLPKGTRLVDLDLDTRTHNCLRELQRQGRIGDASDLADFTIDDLLAITGFGAEVSG